MRTVSFWLRCVLLLACVQAAGCQRHRVTEPPTCSRPEGPAVISGSGRICDPLGFCWASPWPQGNDLHSVWFSPSGEIWTVGGSGIVLRFDGSTWSVSAYLPVDRLSGIWGRDARDIWTVGSAGAIYHFDGSAWTPSSGGGSVDLFGVFGLGTSDVWAVGHQGTLIHFDGAAWTPMSTSTQQPLRAIWGTAPDDLWVGGNSATLLHWDGARFTSWLPAGGFGENGPDVTSIWGTAANNVWFGGSGYESGTVLHWDGKQVNWPDSGASGFVGFDAVYGISGTGPSDVIAVGKFGQAYHFDGALWGPVYTASKASLFAIQFDASGNALAVGEAGAIFSLRGCTWTSIQRRPMPNYANPLAVNSDDDVWALGTGAHHWDGNDWTEFPLGTSASMFTTWTNNASDIWAGGESGTLIHWDGRAWSVTSSPVSTPIYSIWGSGSEDVYASASGVLIHWDGRSWSKVAAAQSGFFGMLWGSSASDIWSTVAGTTLHYDGTAWSKVTGAYGLYVWGRAANDVWIYGGSPVLHWDGVSFTPQMNTMAPFSSGGWGPSADDLWFTTYEGNLAHWDGTAWSLETVSKTISLYGLTGHGRTTWLAGYQPGAVLYRPGR